MERLSDEDLLWLAEKIHSFREDLRLHPRWRRRIELGIDGLLWSASVDGVSEGTVVQDGWIPSGQRLREEHFQVAPHTEAAWGALRAGNLKAIEREHVVPRATLRKIVLSTPTASETKRVIAAYSLVALVHEDECGRLVHASKMPQDWAQGVDWSTPPAQLPSAWARYEAAQPQVVPRWHDGRSAFVPRS